MDAINTLFAGIYEWRFIDGFSQNMYENSLYMEVALTTLGIAFAFALIFYLIIDNARFNRYYHWGVVLVLCLIASYTIGFIYPENKLFALGFDYPSQIYSSFALTNLPVAFVSFVFFSAIFRFTLSTNCSTTPFPN